MNILVTGANGQLGSEIKELAKDDSKKTYFFEDSKSLDITDFSSVDKYIQEKNINAIINCGAYTAVDKAEDEVEKATAVNANGVENLANAIKKNNGKLIHISTDYVFNGESFQPYKETDEVKPLGAYGKTKRAGEEKLITSNVKAIIIRTSWLYSSFGNNFVKTMLRLGKEREELGVIFDQVGTPTYARDLAKTCLKIISSDMKIDEKSKIYHFSNEGVTSWYDFAKAIFEIAQVDCKVNPIETKDYTTTAKRPHYSLLNKAMIKEDFNIEIPYWRDSLKECIKKYKRKEMKNILITGGAGFIGSHVVRLFVNKYPNFNIINLDVLTYAGNLENLKDIENKPNYTFVKADICDHEKMDALFQEHNIDGVIHLAAESHVDRSIKDPFSFAKTNVLGTLSLLQAAKKHWANDFKSKLFYHVSTDEVYGSLGDEGFFTEATAYDPHSPYSASKASSDHFVRAFQDTYGLPTVISNCSNNYGSYQFPEKLIPLFINNICTNKPLPVYGKGENVRDWLFVNDHARAIDVIFHKGKLGETYNIGGFNEWRNIDLIKVLIKTVDRLLGREEGESEKLITYVTDRAGHDYRYAIDSSKLKDELGWEPSLQFEEGIEKTVKWYLENPDWVKNVTSGDYQKYYNEMYK